MPTLDVSLLEAKTEDEDLSVAHGGSCEERFDRIAFALRAVEIVRPARMTVAVCEGASGLRIEKGRTWGRDPEQMWAVVRVPPTASRAAIALAVSRLGLERVPGSGVAPAPRPYALDVLIAVSERADS
jgi:hypothetical protein